MRKREYDFILYEIINKNNVTLYKEILFLRRDFIDDSVNWIGVSEEVYIPLLKAREVISSIFDKKILDNKNSEIYFVSDYRDDNIFIIKDGLIVSSKRGSFKNNLEFDCNNYVRRLYTNIIRYNKYSNTFDNYSIGNFHTYTSVLDNEKYPRNELARIII